MLQERYLALDIDGVLHGQGRGNPDSLRQRLPHVTEAPSRALEKACRSSPRPYRTAPTFSLTSASVISRVIRAIGSRSKLPSRSTSTLRRSTCSVMAGLVIGCFPSWVCCDTHMEAAGDRSCQGTFLHSIMRYYRGSDEEGAAAPALGWVRASFVTRENKDPALLANLASPLSNPDGEDRPSPIIASQAHVELHSSRGLQSEAVPRHGSR